VALAIYVYFAVCLWRIFEKAGIAGYKAIVPFYNLAKLCQVAGKPSWIVWVIAFGLCVPVIGNLTVFVSLFYLYYFVAKRFGHGTGFAFGLFFLPPVYFGLLAFGDATWSFPQQDRGAKKKHKSSKNLSLKVAASKSK